MIDLAGSLHEQRHGQNAEGMCKTAADLERYRAVIARTEPDAIIEIGTWEGHSAIWFAREAAKVAGTVVPVFTVDVAVLTDYSRRQTGREVGVTWHIGPSLDGPTLEAAAEWADGHRRTMVVLDGDHSAGTVYRELQAYSRFVGPGCYLVVEDGITRWLPEQWDHYRHGPLDAIETWLQVDGNDARWHTDQAVENMSPTTQFPGGWLRRR